MIKMHPPYTTEGLHLWNCSRIPQQSRLHLTSCRAKSNHLSQVFFLFSPLYFVFCCFVLIPLCFIWLLKLECLAFGNKSLWANSLCALERKPSPACTSNCVLLRSPEPLPKLEPQELGQDCTLPGRHHWAGPYRLALGSPVFCQLGILSRALIPHYLNCIPWANRPCCQCAQDLKLTIPDQCLRGAALNFNNTIKFLEYEIHPDCRFCIFCTFSLWSYLHTHRTWAQCSVSS